MSGQIFLKEHIPPPVMETLVAMNRDTIQGYCRTPIHRMLHYGAQERAYRALYRHWDLVVYNARVSKSPCEYKKGAVMFYFA